MLRRLLIVPVVALLLTSLSGVSHACYPCLTWCFNNPQPIPQGWVIEKKIYAGFGQCPGSGGGPTDANPNAWLLTGG